MSERLKNPTTLSSLRILICRDYSPRRALTDFLFVSLSDCLFDIRKVSATDFNPSSNIMATIQFSEGVDVPVPLSPKKKLLNNIVDGMAKTRPSALYAEIPNSLTTYEAGFRKITYEILANAINGVAWWLKKTLGTSQTFETLTYIGPSDLQYVIMLLGAVKAGYKIRDRKQHHSYQFDNMLTQDVELLLVSPRNTIPAYISLFEVLQCKTLIIPSEPTLPVVNPILKVHQLQLLRSPPAKELFENTYPHYPFRKTFEEARGEPLVVVCTYIRNHVFTKTDHLHPRLCRQLHSIKSVGATPWLSKSDSADLRKSPLCDAACISRTGSCLIRTIRNIFTSASCIIKI